MGSLWLKDQVAFYGDFTTNGNAGEDIKLKKSSSF